MRIAEGSMAASYLQHHMERSNGIVLPHIRGVEVGGGGGVETYNVSFLRFFSQCSAR